MIKTKYEITNLGSSIILLSYQNFGDGIWVYQATLLPGQTKHIWCNFDTLSYSGPSKNIKIVQLPTNVCGLINNFLKNEKQPETCIRVQIPIK